ncbi:FAD-dependent oxidoreductase [Celeribacter halophilus]|uniref:FAD-dependent oxidoreductase n=1 Tax=Celeribacter halophilus TaxID=576117 RepID=UPI002FD45C4B
MNALPAPRNLVLIGGGHSHALILKHWGLSPLPDVRVTVINPGAVAAYSGMLPGFVAGHYPREALELDILRLAEFAGGCAVMGRATAIDRENRLVHIEGQPPNPYDIASVDIGITSAMPDLAGFADHGIPAKPLEAFATRWDAFRRKAHAGEIAPEVAIIGGGVAGAELALAMAYALRSVSNTQVSLIDHSDILSEMRPATRRAVLKTLAKAGVQLRPQSRVAEVRADEMVFADGSTLPAQFTLGAAGARPYGWLTQTGLALQDGFIKVGPTLQSSDPRVFACGDCAHLTHAPRPKAGVFAVREAPVLFDNLQSALRDGGEARLRPYHPQKDYLKLVSLGRKSALADKSGLRVSGPLIWRWKDHIDRTFMKRVKDLPQASDKAI